MGRVVGYLMLGWLLAAAAGVYGQADTAFVQRRDWLTGQREMFPDWLLETPSEGRFVCCFGSGTQTGSGPRTGPADGCFSVRAEAGGEGRGGVRLFQQ